jgi:hypothetical protein
MSTVLLVKPSIAWGTDARAEIESRSSWFKEFDQVLDDLVTEQPLTVRRDADTWYFVNDIDVSSPTDPAPNLGLDTWDF